MHEWALADGIISTALRVAEENEASKIIEIRIKIGALQQIDIKPFKVALKEISKGTPADESKKKIETESAKLKCRICGKKWDFDNSKGDLDEVESESIHFIPDLAHTYIRCPECNSPDFKIKKGRGVWLDSVKLER